MCSQLNPSWSLEIVPAIPHFISRKLYKNPKSLRHLAFKAYRHCINDILREIIVFFVNSL
jgi:hypothetical protein